MGHDGNSCHCTAGRDEENRFNCIEATWYQCIEESHQEAPRQCRQSCAGCQSHLSPIHLICKLYTVFFHTFYTDSFLHLFQPLLEPPISSVSPASGPIPLPTPLSSSPPASPASLPPLTTPEGCSKKRRNPTYGGRAKTKKLRV